MKNLQCFFHCVLVWATAFVGLAWAEESAQCKLELVRLESPRARVQRGDEWMFSYVYPQHFFMQVQKDVQHDSANNFKDIVKKEPEKYLSDRPFRGVAKLGSHDYGFVLDKKDEESKGYDRLYFDLNCNGDLTDDKPIDALTSDQPAISTSEDREFFFAQFFRVDLTIDVDGKKLDYSFNFSINSQRTKDFQYASASLNSAVYRRGELIIDGQSHKVAVVDFNSNGRFDDLITANENVRGSEGQMYPQYGDVLCIDPEKASPSQIRSYSSSNEYRQFISQINNFAGKFYEVKVSPTGEELTCTPSTAPLGQITSPYAPCHVELIGDQGYLTIKLEKSQPTSIPVGVWRVLSYDINITDWKEPEKKEDAKKEEPKEKDTGALTLLFEAITKAITGPSVVRPEPMYGPATQSLISARGTYNSEPVTVEADQTATLKFGPPYKPQINVYPSPTTPLLNLAFKGADGEVISNLYVNGRRPPKPEFTITDPQGEVVEKGSFEYG